MLFSRACLCVHTFKRKKLSMTQAGFTLIELLIAIVILAVLVLLSMINAPKYLEKSRDTKRKNDLHVLKIAMEDYFDDHECYPDQAEMLDESNCNKTQGTVLEGYVKKFPCDPGTKKPYEYIRFDCKTFFVFTDLGDTNDAAISKLGCDAEGCGVNGSGINNDDYQGTSNYGVSSANVSVDAKISPARCGGTCNPGCYDVSGCCPIYTHPGRCSAGGNWCVSDPSCGD